MQLKNRNIYLCISTAFFFSRETKVEKVENTEKNVMLINSIRTTTMILEIKTAPSAEEWGEKNDKRMTNAISLLLCADTLCMPDVSKTIAIFF